MARIALTNLESREMASQVTLLFLLRLMLLLFTFSLLKSESFTFIRALFLQSSIDLISEFDGVSNHI